MMRRAGEKETSFARSIPGACWRARFRASPFPPPLYGDILATYAVLGFLLLRFAPFGENLLAWWPSRCWSGRSGGAAGALRDSGPQLESDDPMRQACGGVDSRPGAGTSAKSCPACGDSPWPTPDCAFSPSTSPCPAGLYAGRRGIFDDIPGHLGLFRASGAGDSSSEWRQSPGRPVCDILAGVAFLGVLAFAFGARRWILLRVVRRPPAQRERWRRWLGPVAAIGRRRSQTTSCSP